MIVKFVAYQKLTPTSAVALSLNAKTTRVRLQAEVQNIRMRPANDPDSTTGFLIRTTDQADAHEYPAEFLAGVKFIEAAGGGVLHVLELGGSS